MKDFKSRLLKHKWVIVFLLVIVVVGFCIMWLGGPQGDFVDERVVYIRGIDRDNLTYYATVDDVRASLDTPTNKQTNTRDFSSIQKIALASDAKVELINPSGVTSVSALKSLLLAQPVYTGKVFTIVLKGGQIVSLKEENLE